MMGERIEPLVSVVTPFFNTEQYLAESIESVLAQTYQNWEYVLVNNCSTDGSAEMAKKYADIDERIRLIHNDKFLSQVQNYNHALRQISSESKYCKIVQADDVIFSDCVYKMVEIAEENQTAGIVSSYRLCGTIVRNVGLNYRESIFKGIDACRSQLLWGGNYFGTPTSIMFRSEIIRKKDKFFIDGIPCEDTYACFEILKNWDLGFVHQVLSYERENNESISSSIRRYDPLWLLSKFIIISIFGNYYLSNEEFEKTYKCIRDVYFRHLAKNFFYKNDKGFWKFHKDGLASIDYQFTYLKILKYIFLEILDMAGNPKKTLSEILNFIKTKINNKLTDQKI